MEAELPSRPHPAIRRVWFWRGLGLGLVFLPTAGWVVTLPLGFGLEGLGVATPIAFAVPWAVLVPAYVVGLVLWVRLAYRRSAYAYDDVAVRVHKGILFRSTAIVPLRRVQQVVVRQGPLLRRHRIASIRLRVATPAGESTADSQLVGVRDPDAVARHLVERIHALRGDA